MPIQFIPHCKRIFILLKYQVFLLEIPWKPIVVALHVDISVGCFALARVTYVGLVSKLLRCRSAYYGAHTEEF